MTMSLNIGTFISENWYIVILIGAIVAMTWLPQRKRNKEVKKMMEEMKKGDWVKTIGGLTGKIVSSTDKYVIVETGPQHVQLMFTRGAIATVGDSPELSGEGISETEVKVATKTDKKK
jgi:preprotein translocase subunit YajC